MRRIPPMIEVRSAGIHALITISILDHHVVLIDAVLPVAMVRRIGITTGESGRRHKRNEPDLDIA